jgi:hypothetical protein
MYMQIKDLQGSVVDRYANKRLNGMFRTCRATLEGSSSGLILCVCRIFSPGAPRLGFLFSDLPQIFSLCLCETLR